MHFAGGPADRIDLAQREEPACALWRAGAQVGERRAGGHCSESRHEGQMLDAQGAESLDLSRDVFVRIRGQ